MTPNKQDPFRLRLAFFLTTLNRRIKQFLILKERKKNPVILRITILALIIGIAGSIQVLTTPTLTAPIKTDVHPNNRAIGVTTAVAKSAEVPVYISALGTVTSFYTVKVKTQINGQLQKVLFQEGQKVKEGDLLAQIDPRPFEAQLTQLEGQLERDKALLANAKLDLNRYQVLYKQDSVSQQTLETQKALVKQYEGTVKADEGQIQAIKLNIIYCKITCPLQGRIGLRFVDPGNYVQTSDTNGIAVLTQTAPITVVFTIPEDNVAKVFAKVQQGETLIIEAYDRLQQTLLDTGSLLAMDNQIDPATGTIKIKGAFENSKETLFPNQFVNIKLLVDLIKEAVLIPTSAVQYGAQGNFVYITPDDQKVRLQYVTIGITYKDDTVIKEGVKVGEKVIKEGIDKLTHNAAIKVMPSQSVSTTPVLESPPVKKMPTP